MPKSQEASPPPDPLDKTALPAAALSGVAAAVPALRTPEQAVAAKPVKRPRWPWAVGVVVIVALIGGLMYVQPWATKAQSVVVETVTQGPVERILAVNGRIAALTSVTVRPLVAGTLTEVAVAEGDVVAKGAVLAQLDTAAQAAVVRQAKAGLDAALVAEDEAKSTLARTTALGSVASRTALDDASRARATSAQEVARMTALMDQANVQLQNLTIRSAMAGTVLALTPSPGQIVDSATSLLTLADMAHLVVETDVDEAYATQIKLGQTAALQLAGEAEVRPGKVSFVSQQVDTASGGLAVKLAFDVPVEAPVGLTVTANIVVDSRDAALTVPRAAVVSGSGGSAVYLLAAGVAKRQVVTVIDWPAARLIVTAGLAAGDVLIADATGITDGLAVTGVTP